MMLTVTLSVKVEPSMPVQVSVYLVCCVSPLEVFVPLVPVQASLISGLFSATVHDAVYCVVHLISDVSPLCTKVGVAVMLPVGGGGGRQPPEQPHVQCWTNASVQDAFLDRKSVV